MYLSSHPFHHANPTQQTTHAPTHTAREIAAFIVDGEAPEEGVRFTGVDYKACSFLQLRLLGDLRRVLGGCFERGLGVFPVVAEVRGVCLRV